MSMRLQHFILCAVTLFNGVAPICAQKLSAAKNPQEKFYKLGHSTHGDAFDVGPRRKPWLMDGIGKTHFQVTSSHAEVQKWFDQGHTLLHSFWYYEAERAFRWCVKLDPECAMAYWGLARATSGDQKRARSFVKEAAKRKHHVSERERMYIEAWEELLGEDETDPEKEKEEVREERSEEFRFMLERICLKYPDDVEAKSLLALESMRTGNRYGNELVLQQILAADPKHPGAHHYRIHTWDGPDGSAALESCALYGQIAPEIGHAQHMPGHIYSGVGMWHEAAIAMDSATRVEKKYMRERMTFPFNNWNYAHNRNYLNYIQEQLGMANAAIEGARQLLAAPLDPDHNHPERGGTFAQGLTSLMRTLIKFERWQDILSPGTLPWTDSKQDKLRKAYAQALAHMGLGNLDRATRSFLEYEELRKEVDKEAKNQMLSIRSMEMKALLALAKGDTLTGLGVLADAAKKELEMREHRNDPPEYANVLYNTLGRAYLEQKSPGLAAAAFEETLRVVRNDAFALSGLVEAYGGLGETEKARQALARLLFVWSDADPGLKWVERAKSTGIDAQAQDSSPRPQRNYKKTVLDHLGPNIWEPYAAPALKALDPSRKQVTLEECRDKNVLLIFYLGEECPHCVKQLVDIGKRKNDFAALDTEILAISSDSPQENDASLKVKDLPVRLLSDPGLENARRFQSFDDFEEMELHSTILIDKRGRVHWSRHGGDPFMDFDFLLKEIRRLNEGE